MSLLTPRHALNKAFLKVKPTRTQIDIFKSQLIQLLEHRNDQESEEFHKNLISDFFKNTAFTGYFINTKGRNDLVIHNGKIAKDSVGVIIEVKKLSNKTEMLSTKNINSKALQELVLYYLRERITHKNLDVKQLIATNFYEWFIFDAAIFEKCFAQNSKLVKQFTDFEEKRLAVKTTDGFYKEIAKPAIDSAIEELVFTHFTMKDYENILKNKDLKDDNQLIALYKLLSPEHLLKLPFANDSNSLNKVFYSELLHIIGLEEAKDGNKKVIRRKEVGQRHAASLLESAITQLDSLDKLRKLDNKNQYGSEVQEQLFNVSLELVITWINRILFLKLLEAQLVNYHQGDTSYAFLNSQKISSFDELNTLFFQVLAKKPNERLAKVNKLFATVPYLNSSLFEVTPLENSCFTISQLAEDSLPVLSQSVLKDNQGKKRTGDLTTLAYLFDFLNAYDFSSEGAEEIQEDNKTLISASVLGLIFEKINGYKDGSFFTPSFITMYMCKETLRRAVLQKFNDTKKWSCTDFNQLYDHIKDKQDANSIINSLKICDPAVGSGHFLVSALNELIVIKSELGILLDKQGKTLRDYDIKVVNDELIITDDDGKIFEYKPTSKESQRIQETLFSEKQTLIENCLFGVDINPNSVKICRLRLWIELLKHAYYKDAGTYLELETLPNIDINIKCGNSLISRFGLDADLTKALKKQKITITKYREAVKSYRHAQSKAEKWEMEELISKIKTDFSAEISGFAMAELSDKISVLDRLKKQLSLLEETKEAKKIREEKTKKAQKDYEKIRDKIEDLKSNKMYQNAFEWRFEFPEVLNDKGDFLGFDVVIGNPPYGIKFADAEKIYYKNNFSNVHVRTPESFNYFWGLTERISKNTGCCNFIVPSSFLSQIEFEKTRKIILENYSLYSVVNLGDNVFLDVATPTCIVGFSKAKSDSLSLYVDVTAIDRNILPISLLSNDNFVDAALFCKNDAFSFVYKAHISILEKCYKNPLLRDIAEEVATGISSGLDKAYVFNNNDIIKNKLEKPLIKKLVVGGEIQKYYLNPTSNKNIIYITDSDNINDYKNIKANLLKYKDVLIKRREAANGKIQWYSLNWPRRKKLFDKNKILIRQTANRIIAAYDDMGWYCLKSGLIIQLPENSELDYFYLLALLNSTLFNFLYHDLVNEDNRIFPEVKPIQLFKLPIYNALKEQQLPIIGLVEQILTLKKGNPQADTRTLEKQIDQLVYALYGLTAAEIAIIEKG